MSCEITLQFVSFVALVALEGSLHHVRSRVVFQMVRLGGSKVALVTSERLFSRVCLLVPVRLAYFYCFIFTLIAMVRLFTRVCLFVRLQVA